MSQTEASAIPDIVPLSKSRRWAVTIGVMTGMLLAALEATVIGTAMPTVIAALGGLAHYSWVFSAYLLTSTVTVPIWGKLSDLYGRRLFYQIGIGVFLIGSILSGLSASMFQLIAFRALQGLGAGALVPLGMTIIGDIYTLRERARMQGLFSGVWGISSVIGPLVGGFITDSLSWRWVFFLNVPIGIAAAIIVGAALREPLTHSNPTIDYKGAATLTAGITLLMLALVESGTAETLVRPRNVVLILASIGLLVLFARIERRAADPIVPLQLLRNRIVTVAVVVGFFAGVAMFGAISFVPLFAQGALGSTATEAGSLLTPLLLSWVAMSIVGGRLMLRLGYRPMVIAGLVVLSTAFATFSSFGRTTPHSWIVADLAFMGAGLGLTMLTLLIAVQQSVPRSQLGISTSLNQFSRSIGGAIGVAVMGALLSAGLLSNLEGLAARRLPGLSADRAAELAASPNALVDPVARQGMSKEVVDALQEALADSLRPVFILGTVLSLMALLVSFWIPGGRAEERYAPPGGHESERGEEMVMEEMATIDAEHQPCVDRERREHEEEPVLESQI